MKIRNGFVSNSSSSSFVVIGDSGRRFFEYENEKILVVDGEFGETEFGWGPDVIDGAESMIIFAYLQAQYCKERGIDYLTMLEKVIKDNSKIKEIKWNITLDWNGGDNWGYIDHQSSAVDGENLEIFESEETLRNFLFDVKSKVVLDNDNH